MVWREERRDVRPVTTVKKTGVLMKKKILFICTHNSARSQIAEGYMKASGIDISQHRSKLIDEFYGSGIETVVTVCDAANKACPFFPGAKEVIHQSFPDPSAFTGSAGEVRTGFRQVRDEIIQWLSLIHISEPTRRTPISY